MHLGIVNPDFFNWVDAHDDTLTMSGTDLVNLHSHSSASNGNEFRSNRNNAMFLVPHDRNLERIRESIATMEAADRLLKDPNRKLQERRRQTLEEIRADAEKNATTGIQSKWSHLICPGTSEAHRWPTPASTLEHRPLSAAAEPAGNGQKQIFDQLGDRLLHGDGANISPAAWAQIPVLRRGEGTTLGELRNYFSSTPAERSVLSNEAWLNLIRTGMQSNGLYVETQTGESNPPAGYDANWQVWAAPYKPTRKEPDKSDEEEERKTREEQKGYEDGFGQQKQKSTKSEFTQAGVAAKQIEEFMAGQGYTWDNLKSCVITATAAEFADHVASIPQGSGEGIAISLEAESDNFNLELRGLNPQTFKQFSSSARRMLQLANTDTVGVKIEADAKGAQEILGKLNNSHTATITAQFD